MITKQKRNDAEQSLARAQSSLDRQDLQGFCAAIKDLQKLVNNESGQWKSAVNFLARSIHSNTSSTLPAGLRRDREQGNS